MLSQLRVENYALVDELSVEFDAGFSVLTGETGAGKSILVGALSLALGERADTDLIRAGSDSALVEAVFDLSTEAEMAERLVQLGIDVGDGLLTLARTVSRSGRSRCHLNGRTTQVAVLREVGDFLVDMHGQHEHQSPLRVETHLAFLDGHAGLDEARQAFSASYRAYLALLSQLQEEQQRIDRLREREDFYRFQLREIREARVEEGEEERLQRERSILQNADKLKSLLSSVYSSLYEIEGCALEKISSSTGELQTAASYDPTMAGWVEALVEIRYRIEDVARQIAERERQIDLDPAELDRTIERLEILNRLKRKYGGSEATIIEREKELEQEIAILETGESTLSDLKHRIDGMVKGLSTQALELSQRRQEAAEKLAEGLTHHLVELGMDGARFEVHLEVEPDDVGPVTVDSRPVRTTEQGIDRVEFLLAANPGEPLRPLVKVASGGEASRIMLALKAMLAHVDQVPTLLFDEIDVGIGGRVAAIVGEKLEAVSRERQVICITHLAQIASRADAHYLVTKAASRGRTVTRVEKLDDEGRTNEVARMLGGTVITKTTLKHAEEMVHRSRGRRTG